jgi:hypothetical protein
LALTRGSTVSAAAEKRVAALLKPYGISAADTKELSVLGREHGERLALESVERRELDGAGRPVVTLPQITEGIDLAGLYELAEALDIGGLDGGGLDRRGLDDDGLDDRDALGTGEEPR